MELTLTIKLSENSDTIAVTDALGETLRTLEVSGDVADWSFSPLPTTPAPDWVQRVGESDAEWRARLDLIMRRQAAADFARQSREEDVQ